MEGDITGLALAWLQEPFTGIHLDHLHTHTHHMAEHIQYNGK